MLNQAQYKELVKFLNGLSETLSDLIIKTKEDYNNNENKGELQLGIMMGKLAVLGEIKNLFRSRADSLYKLESAGVDVLLLDQIKIIQNISTVLSQKYFEIEPNLPSGSEDSSNMIKDQLYYLNVILPKMILILKQSGTIIE
jgi:hypothetical protein